MLPHFTLDWLLARHRQFQQWASDSHGQHSANRAAVQYQRVDASIFEQLPPNSVTFFEQSISQVSTGVRIFTSTSNPHDVRLLLMKSLARPVSSSRLPPH